MYEKAVERTRVDNMGSICIDENYTIFPNEEINFSNRILFSGG